MDNPQRVAAGEDPPCLLDEDREYWDRRRHIRTVEHAAIGIALFGFALLAIWLLAQ